MGVRKKQTHIVLSINNATYQFHHMVVDLFIYQNRKAVQCVLLHLLKLVCNRDKVFGG